MKVPNWKSEEDKSMQTQARPPEMNDGCMNPEDYGRGKNLGNSLLSKETSQKLRPNRVLQNQI